jgi:NAD(P)-dependent dehydrogenase (short-subunit alcohol dehydrogenase family)
VVIVTGGASGIGRATALEFARRKAHVAVIDRDEERGKTIVDEIRGFGSAAFFAADLAIAAEVKRVVEEVRSSFGGVHVLVHCAGIQRYGTAVSTSEQLWEEVLAANLTSAFLMAKYSLPLLVESGGGSVIIVGSAQSVGAIGNSAAYIVSKHGLLGLTRSIAIDFAAQGVRCHCVCPGAIDTPMLRWSADQSGAPEEVLQACERLHLLNRLGLPEEVARVIAFLASNDSSFMTGHPVMVDGGCTVPIGGPAFAESGTGRVAGGTES